MRTPTIHVAMPDGSTYPVNTLLTDGDRNIKLAKSNAASAGYETVGLTLSPAEESGFNVCAFRSPGCTAECLKFTGHNTFNSVRRAQIAKTRALFLNRDAFKVKLFTELDHARTMAHKRGTILAARPNVLSDIPWERVFPDLFSTFYDVQFYDYTKRPDRVVPANYHLTFSRSETNEQLAMREYARGLNVAVVFESADLPKRWNGIRVFSGDETDLRFLDRRGIVGLYAKGSRAKNDQTGFVVRP